MKHLFIINPASGKRSSTQALLAQIRGLSLDYEIAFTEHEGDAQRITQEAVLRGEPTRVYACGGDGTLNEVCNGAAGHPHIAVTNVPKGTGNDFLKIFGPDYRRRFYQLEELSQGPETPFDLIDCNGKLGLDVVCAGVDARVAADVHHFKDLPVVNGKWAYILSLIWNVMFKGISRQMRVQMGELDWDGQAALLCVCNGRYYGGGFMPVGEAMPDDGVLDMLLVPKVGLFTLARLVGKYAKGRYRELDHIIMDYHGQSVTLSSREKPLTVVVDGELMQGGHFTIRLAEKKVNFFYPAGMSYAPQGVPISTPSASL